MCTTASFAPSSLLSSRFSNGTVSFVCLLSAREVFLKSRDAVLELCSRDFYAWLLWKMMIFFSQLRSARYAGTREEAREQEREKRSKRQNERVNWMFSHPNARGFRPRSFREWRSARRFREGIFLAALYPFGDVSSPKGGGGTFYIRLWLTRVQLFLSFNTHRFQSICLPNVHHHNQKTSVRFSIPHRSQAKQSRSNAPHPKGTHVQQGAKVGNRHAHQKSPNVSRNIVTGRDGRQRRGVGEVNQRSDEECRQGGFERRFA